MSAHGATAAMDRCPEDATQSPGRARGWVILIIATLVLHLATAGWGDLFNETDGQYAGAAKAMAESGQWLIPENNGIPRLVKPPLLTWAMAAGMELFGVNAFAARLPGALALLAWVLATARIGEIWGGPRRGFLAGLVLCTMLGAFTLARIVMPEPLFSALIAMGFWCVAEAAGAGSGTRRRRAWILAAWVFAGLAAFTKAPHGALYLLGGAGLVCLWGPRPRALRLRELLFWPGPVLALALNLPWYLAVEARFPGFLENLVGVEFLGHVSGSSAPATNYTPVPRLQFAGLHLAWFFPWSLAALVALPFAWKSFRPPASWSFCSRLIAAWAVLVLASAFLAGQRQDYYAMAMWPTFALLAARILANARPGWPCRVVAGILGLALAATLLAPRLVASETGALAERSTAFGTVSRFGPEIWNGLTLIAALSLIPAMGLCLLARRSFLPLAGAAACIGLGAIAGTARVAPYFSIAPIAGSIHLASGDSGRVYFEGDIDTGSSLLFYTDLRVVLVGADSAADFVVRTRGLGRENYATRGDVANQWKAGEPVALLIESRDLEAWQDVLDSAVQPAARCGTLVLVTNSPAS